VTTVVVLFTRDLRVHDHPALAAACDDADRVVPLFVLDDAIVERRVASPNKTAFLLDAVSDLTSTMRDLGGALITRRGDVAAEVAEVVAAVDADAVHLSDDVTSYARQRLDRLRDTLDIDVVTFPGVTVVPPDELQSSSGGHYERFTPYWRRWRDVAHRPDRRPGRPAPHRGRRLRPPDLLA
jgi:deoxyribodipyrimidine photo-lyase